MKGKDIILGLLKTRGPLTGYEINEILQDQLNHFYVGSYGMIYPTLKKLENSGFVKKEKVSQDDKPNKNVFSILSLGEKEFNKSLYKPLQDDEFKSDFLIKIYFGNQFSKSEFINLIKNEIRIKKENLRLLEDNLEKWKNNGMNDNHKFTYDYGIIYYGSIIRFLENKLKQAENI